jgi:hypothetical protein
VTFTIHGFVLCVTEVVPVIVKPLKVADKTGWTTDETTFEFTVPLTVTEPVTVSPFIVADCTGNAVELLMIHGEVPCVTAGLLIVNVGKLVSVRFGTLETTLTF